MFQPIVSIITPVLNAAAFLPEALSSVKNQTLQNWEHLIVIDFKSTDESLEMAERAAKEDPRIKIIQDPNLAGVCANRNLAIKKATGEFIAFLDADDRWKPEKLQKQVEFMNQHQASISAHSYSRISQQGEPLRGIRSVPLKLDRNDLLADNKVGCLTTMIRKKDFDKIEFVEGDHEDLRLWLDLLTKKPILWGLDENLAEYRIVAGSRSGNKRKSAIARLKIIFNDPHINLPRKIFCFVNYAIQGVKKTI